MGLTIEQERAAEGLCIACGAPLPDERGGKRTYCDSRCAQAQRRKERRAAARPQRVTCKHCGDDFEKELGRRGPSPAYCSKGCQGKARHQREYVPTPRAATTPGAWKHKPGDSFGPLTIVERLANGRAVFACDCGNTKTLAIRNVVAGVSTNCADRQAHPDPRHKGQYLTYSGAHHRVAAQLGRAADRPCVACSGAAEHWAYRHSDHDQRADAKGREAGMTYSADPAHYWAMCRPCHQRWDRGERRINPAGGLSGVHVALFMALTA